MTWDELVEEAAALGFTVELVEYCESADSPGFLGAGLGVCIYGRQIIRIREKLREEDRVWVLEHELGHARLHALGAGREVQKEYDHYESNDPARVLRHIEISAYLYL